MYERFTDRARKVVQLANREAKRFNHEYIGPEELLLGLVKEGSGVAANVLKNLGLDLREIRLEVEKIVRSGPDMTSIGKLPLTPGLKKVIEYSIEEARDLGHNYVGTEHLLLALARGEEGVAALVLRNLGLTRERLRQEVLKLLGPAPAPLAPGESVIERVARWAGSRAGTLLARRRKGSAGDGGPPGAQADAGVTARLEQRTRALERQLVTVRFLLGCVLGAGAGASLGDRVGLAVGLLAGGAVALVGRLVPALLAGGVAGAFVGATYFAGDGGAAAGAAVGGLLAACVAEVGRPPKT